MAKKKPNWAKSVGGPFLAAAVFCENILEDKDKMISPIRILDRLTVQLPDSPPPGLTPMAFVRVFVSFKAGDTNAKHIFRFVMNSPDGKKTEVAKDVKIRFEGKNEHGFNIQLHLPVPIINGLFWFDVYLDDRLTTRMPLRVAVATAPLAPSPEQGS